MPGGRVFSRRDFLRMGGAGLAGAAMLGAAGPAFGQAAGGGMVSALDLGISPKNDGITNRENLVKALDYSSGKVHFPPGDYVIDNSTARPERGLHRDSLWIFIFYFEGELVMEEGARFVFTDEKRRGLNFHGGKGASLRGLATSFVEAPPARITPEECIVIVNTTDTTVEGARIDGSAAAGLMLWNCVRPSVYDVEVKNTMADGVHFANCEDGRAERVHAENTGDDGLAFVNYGYIGDRSGGYANDITVVDGKGRGISVVGQSDVTIENFRVDGTTFNGLYCAQENSYTTRVSSNVKFTNGEVWNAGRVVDPAGKTGLHYGIHYANVSSVEFSDIKVFSPKDRGVSGIAAPFERKTASGSTVSEPGGSVTLKNIEVRDVPSLGFALVGGKYSLGDLTAENTGGTGMAIIESEHVRYENLMCANASKHDGLRRAFLFEKNKTVEGSELRVMDDQAKPTGYKAVSVGDRSGRHGRLHDEVVHGKVRIEVHNGLDILLASEKPAAESARPSSGERERRRKRRMRKRRRRMRRRR